MWERGLISLAVIVCVCIASVAFLPFGSGPYTAVYGPTSALRAQRVLQLLVFVLAHFALLPGAFQSIVVFTRGPVVPVAAPISEIPSLSSLTCSLRC